MRRERIGLVGAAQMLAVPEHGFRADMDEAAYACLARSGEHARRALDIEALPGVLRSPLLDEGGAMHDGFAAAYVGGPDVLQVAAHGRAAQRADGGVGYFRARHGGHGIAALSEMARHRAADEAGCAGDEDAHQAALPIWSRACLSFAAETAASSRRSRSSSTTSSGALATKSALLSLASILAISLSSLPISLLSRAASAGRSTTPSSGRATVAPSSTKVTEPAGAALALVEYSRRPMRSIRS